MFDEDFNEIVVNESVAPFCRGYKCAAQQKKLSKEYGTFTFKETQLKTICISNCEYDIDDDVVFYRTIKQEMLCLTFMNVGNSRFSCAPIGNCTMSQNSCNLFYLSGGEATETQLEKGSGNDVTDVILSAEYIMQLAERFPDVFEGICRKVEHRQSFALYENGMFATPDVQQIARQIKEADLLGNAAALYVEAKIQELFVLLTCKTSGCERNAVPCVLRDKMLEAKYILEKNYNAPPALCELAKQVGVSGTTMKSCFKKMFNTTVYGYLFDYRMSKASSLLRKNTDLNISEIADMTGYEHQAHFCTAFKRKFGMTPSDYRGKACV